MRGARARTAEGSGIGLSIVQDLVSRMGGQLTVRSMENQGSAFTIWMPYKSFRYAVEPVAERAAIATAPAGVAADLLERHQAQQALRESEAKYRSLFERMEEGFAVCELVRGADGHAIDWRHLELNQAWERQTGLSRDEALRSTGRPGCCRALTRCGAAPSSALWMPAKPPGSNRTSRRSTSWPTRKRAAGSPSFTKILPGESVPRKPCARAKRAFVTASSDVVYQMDCDWTEMRRLYGRGFIADTEGPDAGWPERYIPPRRATARAGGHP